MKFDVYKLDSYFIVGFIYLYKYSAAPSNCVMVFASLLIQTVPYRSFRLAIFGLVQPYTISVENFEV